jgi:hypothetical protein
MTKAKPCIARREELGLNRGQRNNALTTAYHKSRGWNHAGAAVIRVAGLEPGDREIGHSAGTLRLPLRGLDVTGPARDLSQREW